MDFGEILKKWESGQPQKTTMQTWLDNNEIIDKDAGIKKTLKPGENRNRLIRIKPDAILDIHGLTSEEAWLSLEKFFVNAKNNGYEKIRVIHGKGNHCQGEAVLKSTVRKFTEQCSFAGESGYENAANGGSGATWVLLKDNPN
ncbi:MAG: Smr/MutS family protein [Treponema sp.]|nr:Smr/MutS family protein [Treponema sp.]